MTMKDSPLLVNLSRRAMRQKHLGTCRQWVAGSLVLALAVTFVSGFIYVKIFCWLLAASCAGYYVHVVRSPVEPSPAPPTGYRPPALAATQTPIRSAQSATHSVPARKVPSLPSVAQVPAPEKPNAYNPAEALKMSDSILRMRKSPSNESFYSAQLPPTTSALFQTQTQTQTQRWDTPAAAASSFMSSPLPITPSRTFQSSPLPASSSASASSPYATTPRQADPSDAIGSLKWGPHSSLRVRDSLQVLQMAGMPDEWVDELRLLLGRHLLSVLKLFDDAAQELSHWLIKATTPPSPGAGMLGGEDLQKVLALLDRSTDSKRIKLTNGSSVSIDEVLLFCKQLNLPAEALHRYEVAGSFFRLCQQMIDLKGGLGDGNTPSNEGRGYRYEDSSSRGAGKKPFLSRLKDMMSHSMDGRIRVQWSHYAAHSAGSSALSDQEVAAAVFLHKCDSLAAWKPAFSHLKFSQVHYATSPKDVQRITSSLLHSASPGPRNSLSSMRSDQDSWCVCLLLNQQPIQGTDIPKTIDTCTSTCPHFDIYRASLRGTAVKEVLSVDKGRNDCFEAMIVLLIVIFLTYQYTDEDADTGREAAVMGAGSAVVDYAVAKDLLLDIIGNEGMNSLLAPKNSDPAEPEPWM